MRYIKCAGMIFLKNGKILLEDRRKICKHGEHWSFFGGCIEEGETIKQALRRELFEETSYRPNKYEFFKKYVFKVNNLHLTYYMFMAEMPHISKLKIHKKAGTKIATIKQALKLKITEQDKIILRDILKIKSPKY